MVELTPKLRVFTFWDLDALRKFSNLKKLTLRDDNIVSDSWLHELPKVAPQLDALALRFVATVRRKGTFTKAGIQSLLKLEYLTHLEVAGSYFSSAEGIKAISTKLNLTYLDLSENGLQHRCVRPLKELTNLETLILGGNVKLGDSTVRLMQKFPNLRHLSFRGCPSITDDGISSLASSTTLTSLDLRMCTGISGAGLGVCGVVPITRLDLMGCSALDDTGLSYVCHFKFLKFLDLRLCTRITDAGLELLKGLSSLMDLRIGSGKSLITNLGLTFMPHLPCLEQLTLFFLQEVTHKGLESVCLVESLRKLTIVQCRRIDDRVIKQLPKRPPELIIDFYPCTDLV